MCTKRHASRGPESGQTCRSRFLGPPERPHWDPDHGATPPRIEPRAGSVSKIWGPLVRHGVNLAIGHVLSTSRGSLFFTGILWCLQGQDDSMRDIPSLKHTAHTSHDSIVWGRRPFPRIE